MRKRAINYVPVLPLELRPFSSLNRYSDISNSNLEKIGKQGRDEEKSRVLPKKKHHSKKRYGR
jgi:hypothetical protein